MREKFFVDCMMQDGGITSKEKAVRSRLSKAHAVEEALGSTFDSIVCDDNKMYEALLKIKSSLKDSSGSYSNTLRKYYQYVNGRNFPHLREFEK